MIKTDSFSDIIWCRKLAYLECLDTQQWGERRERDVEAIKNAYVKVLLCSTDLKGLLW